ncbi:MULTISPECIES: hypothetical protein [unclassified Sinorhizobium]|uniref:hypothetical protein n=1 Tax=unclassified Sinorhizobium TaxID=2613772 RepID=UPI0035232ACF
MRGSECEHHAEFQNSLLINPLRGIGGGLSGYSLRLYLLQNMTKTRHGKRGLSFKAFHNTVSGIGDCPAALA